MAILRGQQEAVEPALHDRNKTALTHNVTMGAIEHLRYIGVKAIETEVPVADKWIADLAGLWSPTPTECLRSKLLPPRNRVDVLLDMGELGGPPISVSQDDPEQKWYDIYGQLPWCITIVHEVKTSLADFTSDDKFTREPVADLQILSYPSGVIPDAKLPKHWWLWEHRAGGVVRKVAPCPKLFNPTDGQRFTIAASIAERQHNKTHNKWWSDLQKKQSIEAAGRKIKTNIRDIANAIMRVAKGEMKPDEVHDYYFHRIKRKYEEEYIRQHFQLLFRYLIIY